MATLLGRKLGMTELFDEAGHRVPVTLVEAGPVVVVDRRTADRDGYEAARLGFGAVKERRLSKAQRGVYGKAGVTPQRHLREVRGAAAEGLEAGQTLNADAFSPGDVVDVVGTSRGKGFTGAMKRHGFGGQRDTHGVSLMHRAVGSIGSSNIARVIPGKRMPGRAGGARVTVRGLRVIKVEAERNLLYLRGATPGIRGSLLLLRGVAAKSGRKRRAGTQKEKER